MRDVSKNGRGRGEGGRGREQIWSGVCVCVHHCGSSHIFLTKKGGGEGEGNVMGGRRRVLSLKSKVTKHGN